MPTKARCLRTVLGKLHDFRFDLRRPMTLGALVETLAQATKPRALLPLYASQYNAGVEWVFW
jgi:hypothetical protein